MPRLASSYASYHCGRNIIHFSLVIQQLLSCRSRIPSVWLMAMTLLWGLLVANYSLAAENKPPVAIAQTFTIKEDTKKTFTLRGIDPEKQKLTYSIVQPPTSGARLELKGNVVTYTPTPNYFSPPNQPDSFTFKVNDGQLDSAPATVMINVTPVNDAPVAQNASVSAVKDTAWDITLDATDIEGDALTYVPAKKSQKGGSVTLKAGNVVTYTPKKGFVGEDSFTFTATDSKGAKSKPATITLIVRASPSITLKPIPTIPSSGNIGILALNPNTTKSLTKQQYDYLTQLVNKANSLKLVAGGQVHWKKLGKVEATDIAFKSKELFGDNAVSNLIVIEKNNWVKEYQETIPARFKATNPFPWVTVKGWKATADALVNSLKAGVGAAKIAYSAAPITSALGITKKLSAADLATLEKKLKAVEVAAMAFECGEFGLSLDSLHENSAETWNDILTKGGACLSSLADKKLFHKFFEANSVAENINNGEKALAMIDFLNFLVGLAPESPPTTALSGLLDMLSAAINSQIIAAEYNEESLQDMLLAQSKLQKEIDSVLDDQLAWYTQRLINARLTPWLVIKYVDADFTFTPYENLSVGVEINFEARAFSTKGEIISYVWDFGDGNKSVSEGFLVTPKTKHIYAKAGKYTVKLTTKSGFLGLEDTIEKTITVGEALDKDKDGLPDWWEAKYGVSDPAADDDGDGLKNIDEYKAGTIPKGEGAKDTDGDGFTDGEEVSAKSDPLDKAKYPNPALAVPQNVKAEAGNTQVTLSWDAVTGATGYAYCTSPTQNSADCATYSASNPLWKDVTQTSVVVTGLQNGNTYFFRVVTKGANGKISAVSEECPAKPNKSDVDGIFPPSLKIRFDQASLDALGADYHGMYELITGRNGGTAAKFSGIHNPGHIRIPNRSEMQFTDAATFDMWVRADSIRGMDGWGRISDSSVMSLLAKSHDRTGLTILIGPSPTAVHSWFATYDPTWRDANCQVVKSATNIPLNTWFRVTMVASSTEGTAAYLNKELMYTCPNARPSFDWSNRQDLYIGKFSDYWYPLDGAIQDVNIYKQALTKEQVQALP